MKTWTKEPPTEAGFYWMKYVKTGFAEPVSVFNWNGEMLFFGCGNDNDEHVEKACAADMIEWYGPITPPQEASDE